MTHHSPASGGTTSAPVSATTAAITLRGAWRKAKTGEVLLALTLGARVFVSFDDRQRKLARRARLKVLPRIRPEADQPRWNAM